jgi:uncharacterized protein YndB with AHSA1/START domain
MIGAMSTERTPTGRRDTRDADVALVLERQFARPREDVWAALTDPVQLERWIGTWTGDPASGTVDFAMTAEGDDVEPGPATILACRPPELLAVSLGEGWRLELELADSAGGTRLVFAHLVDDAAAMADVGPGWEYYLDRLAAALSDTDVGAIDFADYHPGQCQYYRGLFAG